MAAVEAVIRVSVRSEASQPYTVVVAY
jgi:hypothetical protein